MRTALGKRVPHWHIPLSIFKFLAVTGDIGKKLTGRRLPFNSDALTKLFGSAQYSLQRIQNELNFEPIYNFKKMLPEIIIHYKKQ